MDKAPDAFRTISEVADDLDVPQHVLRFWETRFAQIRPMKRSGGRRYYRPDDIDLLRGIRRLLYGEGYTIRGVQRILKEHGVKAVQAFADGAPLSPSPALRGAAAPQPQQDEAVGSDADEAAGHDDDDDDAIEVAAGGDDADAGAAVHRPPVARPREVPPAAPAAAVLDAAGRERLRAALDDLIACRAVLDRVLKDHPGQPLPE